LKIEENDPNYRRRKEENPKKKKEREKKYSLDGLPNVQKGMQSGNRMGDGQKLDRTVERAPNTFMRTSTWLVMHAYGVFTLFFYVMASFYYSLRLNPKTRESSAPESRSRKRVMRLLPGVEW